MNIDFSTARLTGFHATWVGCKMRFEGISLPAKTTPLNDLSEEMLMNTFSKTFGKTAEIQLVSQYYRVGTEDLPNLAFQGFSALFTEPEDIKAKSEDLSKLLYEFSDNPKIQGGEFFVLYFEDMVVDGSPASAIGLWKVQNKTQFYETDRSTNFTVVTAEGIATAKQEVAAMIFNLGQEDDYMVVSIDKVTKKGERSFWKDSFLHLRPLEDDYYQTRHHIAITNEFITSKGMTKLGMNRVEIINTLNGASDYFKDQEEFDLVDFAQKVFKPEDGVQFIDFVEQYEKAYGLSLEEQFNIDTNAVKKDVKVFKSVLQLDDNFIIEVKSRADLLERSVDEQGRTYYKVYFEQEF